MNLEEKTKKNTKEELQIAKDAQKKTRSKKGEVKITPVTATLASAYFMWQIGEFWKNTQENDVAKIREWFLSDPELEEEGLLERLGAMVEMSSLMMSSADIVEANLLQNEPESVILTMYYFLRKRSEAKGELTNKAEVEKFNRKAFRVLFNSYNKTPLFKKKYKEIHRLMGNDDKHKYQWQRKTENGVKARFSKMDKKLNERYQKVAPKLYSRVMEILKRFYQITFEMEIDTK
jgi:hypothetical protein